MSPAILEPSGHRTPAEASIGRRVPARRVVVTLVRGRRLGTACARGAVRASRLRRRRLGDTGVLENTGSRRRALGDVLGEGGDGVDWRGTP